MTTEQLLRDALHDDAGTTLVPRAWDDVRTRGTHLRRRRRVAQGTVATAAVLAVAAGAFALAGTFSDGGGTRRGVVATPTPAVGSDRIVVERADRVEILDATDGHVVTTVATGVDGAPGGVTVTPDGSAVIYTRPSSTGRCGPELDEQPLARGARAHVLVGDARNPLVSPDGRWVAYVMNERCENQGGGPAADFVGITDLRTGRNYRPYEQELGDHPAKLAVLAWSPDSNRLLFNEQRAFPDGSDQKTFVLTDPPLAVGGNLTPLPLSEPVSAAAYASDDQLLVARPLGNQSEVVLLDANSGTEIRRRIAFGPGPPASVLQLRPDGRLLVVEPSGVLFVEGGALQSRLLDRDVRSAAWLPPKAAVPTTVVVPNVGSSGQGVAGISR